MIEAALAGVPGESSIRRAATCPIMAPPSPSKTIDPRATTRPCSSVPPLMVTFPAAKKRPVNRPPPSVVSLSAHLQGSESPPVGIPEIHVCNEASDQPLCNRLLSSNCTLTVVILGFAAQASDPWIRDSRLVGSTSAITTAAGLNSTGCRRTKSRSRWLAPETASDLEATSAKVLSPVRLTLTDEPSAVFPGCSESSVASQPAIRSASSAEASSLSFASTSASRECASACHAANHAPITMEASSSRPNSTVGNAKPRVLTERRGLQNRASRRASAGRERE